MNMSQRQASPSDASNLESVAERTRIPFSAPTLKLAVPEIPGFHLHWFIGSPSRIQRAIQAGYEFVDPSEVQVNNHLLGSNPLTSGNTDLGSRVSIVAGGEDIGADGQATRLYLMKIKEEWWQQDQAAQIGPGSRLEGVRNALLSGMLGREGQRGEDNAQVYVDTKRTKIPDYLNPNKGKK
jgi:hypothetical protein